MGLQRVRHSWVIFTFTFNLEDKNIHLLYNSIMPTFHNSELPQHSTLCKYTFYYSSPIPGEHNFDSKSQAFTWQAATSTADKMRFKVYHTSLVSTPPVCVNHSVVSHSLQPMDYSLPDSSVHENLQARIPECVAISFSRESSQSRHRTRVSWIAGRCFTIWATREAPH